MISNAIAPDSILAVGDIHGCIEALESLLKILLPLPNKVVFLGDYVDRGPSSPRVVGLLIFAKLMRPDWIFLAGNHEFMLLEQEFLELDPIDSNSGYAQYLSIGGIPSSHRKFLGDLDFYHESKSFLFIHGGIAKYIDPDIEYYSLDEIVWTYRIDREWAGKTIVRGHQPVEQPDVCPHYIGLDTACVFGGWLSAGLLDDASGKMLGAVMVSTSGENMKFWTPMNAD